MKKTVQDNTKVGALIELAEKHAANVNRDARFQSSATASLEDARLCYRSGRLYFAVLRATDSLRYSVGVFHEDYKVAVSILKGMA